MVWLHFQQVMNVMAKNLHIDMAAFFAVRWLRPLPCALSLSCVRMRLCHAWFFAVRSEALLSCAFSLPCIIDVPYGKAIFAVQRRMTELRCTTACVFPIVINIVEDRQLVRAIVSDPQQGQGTCGGFNKTKIPSLLPSIEHASHVCLYLYTVFQEKKLIPEFHNNLP
jgi:hypothetical protein